ncbi:MAG: hypothetical protein ACT4QC_03970 [Planctomycetaceae bacterium]
MISIRSQLDRLFRGARAAQQTAHPVIPAAPCAAWLLVHSQAEIEPICLEALPVLSRGLALATFAFLVISIVSYQWVGLSSLTIDEMVAWLARIDAPL